MDRTCLGSCETLKVFFLFLCFAVEGVCVFMYVFACMCVRRLMFHLKSASFPFFSFFSLSNRWILQSSKCLPRRFRLFVSIYILHACLPLCVCVCGQPWKHVLAVSRVNVRRTWGRSRYNSPYPPLLAPHGAFYSQHPLAKHPPLFLSVSLSLSLAW